MIRVKIDEALPSIANKRMGWQKQYGVFKKLHLLGYWETVKSSCDIKNLTSPVTIELIRGGPRKLDFDNLVYAFKPFRDGIAEALWPEKSLRTRDDHDGVRWEYSQEKSKKRFIQINFYSAEDVEMMAQEGREEYGKKPSS